MKRIKSEKISFPTYNDKEVLNAWNWIKSFIGEKKWAERKEKIETKLSNNKQNNVTTLTLSEDKIGWYLYLIDTIVNSPYKYEPFQGARVLPVFKRIGIYLDEIKSINGINKKIRELIYQRKSEADNILFEILTASLWKSNGYEVSFIHEKTMKKTMKKHMI